ncbi:MAG: alpha/beta fold hydrolase [Actinomycetaceae bacterium]|nr:alpha/beta fold hydrolase [Actinomycetaceae bacterium]
MPRSRRSSSLKAEDVTPRRHRSTPRYYAARRVPETMWIGDAMDVLAPLAARLGVHLAVRAASQALPLTPELSAFLKEFSRREGESILEEAQRRFFDNPGVDTLLVQAMARAWRVPVGLGKTYLRAKILLGVESERARETLRLIPKRDFEALMASYLAIGTALGWFRGGTVAVNLWYKDGAFYDLPGGSAQTKPRRVEAPRTLTDMARDIDDLYWVEAPGQPVKITRVGEGQVRRWLISLPGTDHMDPISTMNPADAETNTREVLGLSSAMQKGVVAALHHAMESEGVSPRNMVREPVIIMGHSQGGMVALSLAERHPREVNVRGVVTLGTPGRRLRVSRDVAALAVEHDQDVVPSMDGRPRRRTDDRVVVGRHLIRPRTGPLFYAHSSSTYTETVQLMERHARVAPNSKIGRTVARIRPYLPAEGESSSVYVYEVRQDLLSGVAPDIREAISVFARLPEGVYPAPVIREVVREAAVRPALEEWKERRSRGIRREDV